MKWPMRVFCFVCLVGCAAMPSLPTLSDADYTELWQAVADLKSPNMDTNLAGLETLSTWLGMDVTTPIVSGYEKIQIYAQVIRYYRDGTWPESPLAQEIIKKKKNFTNSP